MTPKRTAVTTTTTTAVIDAQLKALIDRGVADALAEIEANKTSENGDDNHNSGTSSRRTERAASECNYSDFLKFACQIKFSNCTLQGKVLTWWNSHVKTVGHDFAYAMTWNALKKMMTDKYFPKGEIKKLEIELWNLKVKGTDVESYSQRFQELALMCDRMFLEESDVIEKYVGGLPDMIHGSLEKGGNLNNNEAQQQPPKNQGVAIAYTAGYGLKGKEYAEFFPLCNKVPSFITMATATVNVRKPA
ncbi:reverse transcriptase domain-containing protein [Tanacetum coccineum]